MARTSSGLIAVICCRPRDPSTCACAVVLNVNLPLRQYARDRELWEFAFRFRAEHSLATAHPARREHPYAGARGRPRLDGRLADQIAACPQLLGLARLQWALWRP